MKNLVKLFILAILVNLLACCASQDSIMGQQVPNTQDVPLSQQMPPVNDQ